MIGILAIVALACAPRFTWARDGGYVVVGESMSPALAPGDRVVIDGAGQPPGRGELVAIKLRSSPTPVIKRVAAVPGDAARVAGGALLVNGREVQRVDLRRWRSTIRQLERYGNRVPARFYLVLGDNHAASMDSGRLGLVSEDQLLGRAVKVGAPRSRGPGR